MTARIVARPRVETYIDGGTEKEAASLFVAHAAAAVSEGYCPRHRVRGRPAEPGPVIGMLGQVLFALDCDLCGFGWFVAPAVPSDPVCGDLRVHANGVWRMKHVNAEPEFDGLWLP